VVAWRDYVRMQSSLVVLGLLMPFVAIVSGPGAVYYGWKALRRMEASGNDDGRASAYLYSVLGRSRRLAASC